MGAANQGTRRAHGPSTALKITQGRCRTEHNQHSNQKKQLNHRYHAIVRAQLRHSYGFLGVIRSRSDASTRRVSKRTAHR